MNWGKSIILAFILFGAFIGTLVTVCVRQDVNLVTRDYYEQELEYQDQIDRIEHTAMLREKPFIKVGEGRVLKIEYPDFSRVQKGALELFRPSDARFDKTFVLQPTTSLTQSFSTDGMLSGMYRARMRWTMGGDDYFIEQIIFL